MTTVETLMKRLDSLHVMLGVVLALALVNLTLAAVTLLGL
jgi:hypothetical protein